MRDTTGDSVVSTNPPSEPDLGPLLSVDGIVIPPTQTDSGRPPGYEVLIGLEVTGTQPSEMTGLVVTYELGDEIFRVTLDSQVAVCVPSGTTDTC